jgi:hypothetical protein
VTDLGGNAWNHKGTRWETRVSAGNFFDLSLNNIKVSLFVDLSKLK